MPIVPPFSGLNTKSPLLILISMFFCPSNRHKPYLLGSLRIYAQNLPASGCGCADYPERVGFRAAPPYDFILMVTRLWDHFSKINANLILEMLTWYALLICYDRSLQPGTNEIRSDRIAFRRGQFFLGHILQMPGLCQHEYLIDCSQGNFFDTFQMYPQPQVT